LLGDQTPPPEPAYSGRANNSPASQKIKKARETNTAYAERAFGCTLHAYLRSEPHFVVQESSQFLFLLLPLQATLTLSPSKSRAKNCRRIHFSRSDLPLLRIPHRVWVCQEIAKRATTALGSSATQHRCGKCRQTLMPTTTCLEMLHNFSPPCGKRRAQRAMRQASANTITYGAHLAIRPAALLLRFQPPKTAFGDQSDCNRTWREATTTQSVRDN
jgi:hypothetical protein